jgi:hypothetical protein
VDSDRPCRFLVRLNGDAAERDSATGSSSPPTACGIRRRYRVGSGTSRCSAAHRYDGYIVQSTGDGIFALFGAPVAHEDHPQRASYAALRLQEILTTSRLRLCASSTLGRIVILIPNLRLLGSAERRELGDRDLMRREPFVLLTSPPPEIPDIYF